ncbi:hypothetical protein UCRPC4_g03225 [Phaeomoniella chlamydospora]|uniref:Uncharacterized protein n=1 Tax=Phaeomoniella chlamydospora TaxID=158046 RepID=A0A0G2GG48_PHACM|nr:hypothetical protein UCRPC4_g03225 [Phaeomoniella chlamydospora]
MNASLSPIVDVAILVVCYQTASKPFSVRPVVIDFTQNSFEVAMVYSILLICSSENILPMDLRGRLHAQANVFSDSDPGRIATILEDPSVLVVCGLDATVLDYSIRELVARWHHSSDRSTVVLGGNLVDNFDITALNELLAALSDGWYIGAFTMAPSLLAFQPDRNEAGYNFLPSTLPLSPVILINGFQTQHPVPDKRATVLYSTGNQEYGRYGVVVDSPSLCWIGVQCTNREFTRLMIMACALTWTG